MARLNIEDEWWLDPRREAFIKKVGDTQKADGLVLQFWKMAQEAYKANKLVNKKKFKMLGHWKDFIECELAEEREDGIYIKGSRKQFEWLFKKVTAGKKGGEKAAKSRRSKSKDLHASTVVALSSTSEANSSTRNPHSHSHSHSQPHTQTAFSDSFEKQKPSVASLHDDASGPDGRPSDRERAERNKKIWHAFKAAYMKKYKVEPVRNAKTNKNISDLRARLGAAVAEQVVEFYLTHNDRYYVGKMHDIGLCLRDAESLRTQMLKGKAVTQNDLKQFEQNDHYRSQIERARNGEI